MCMCRYCFTIKLVTEAGEVLICHTQSVMGMETNEFSWRCVLTCYCAVNTDQKQLLLFHRYFIELFQSQLHHHIYKANNFLAWSFKNTDN